MCQKYENITGIFFASFINEDFEEMFLNSKKSITTLLIQDSDIPVKIRELTAPQAL